MKKSDFERLVSVSKLSEFDKNTASIVIKRIEFSRFIDQQDFLQLAYLFHGMNQILASIICAKNTIEMNEKLRHNNVSSNILTKLIREYCLSLEDTINSQIQKDE